MSGNRIVLQGLRLRDYVHPAEAKFHGRESNDASLVQKGLAVLNDVSVQLLQRITLGRYVEMTEETAPELFALVRDVCRILDYPQLPRLYVRHARGYTISVGGTDHLQMLIPDYILSQYDEDMLYYMFGNAISMFKSDHVKLATVCSVLGDSPATLPFKLPLEACMRAADLTSDRGGLLCCQRFPAAARCLLLEAGLPLSELRGMDGEETERLVLEFLDEANGASADLLADMSALWKKLSQGESPAFLRLRELYAWYRDGYDAVLSKWTGGAS